MLNKGFLKTFLGLAFALSTASASALVTTQLGAALDASGSMSAADFTLQKQGWADAVASLPVDGSVEVTVVRFASSADVVVGPVVVDSVAARTTLVADISAISQSGNGSLTDIAEAITTLSDAMLDSADYSAAADSFMNLATDGQQTAGGSAIDAATDAQAGGIDALTAEGVGTGVSLNDLGNLVFNPTCNVNTDCDVLLAADSLPPSPAISAWVLPVTDFTAFGAAIGAKVQAIATGVPEPASLALMAIGLVGFASLRRRQRIV